MSRPPSARSREDDAERDRRVLLALRRAGPDALDIARACSSRCATFTPTSAAGTRPNGGQRGVAAAHVRRRVEHAAEAALARERFERRARVGDRDEVPAGRPPGTSTRSTGRTRSSRSSRPTCSRRRRACAAGRAAARRRATASGCVLSRTISVGIAVARAERRLEDLGRQARSAHAEQHDVRGSLRRGSRRRRPRIRPPRPPSSSGNVSQPRRSTSSGTIVGDQTVWSFAQMLADSFSRRLQAEAAAGRRLAVTQREDLGVESGTLKRPPLLVEGGRSDRRRTSRTRRRRRPAASP